MSNWIKNFIFIIVLSFFLNFSANAKEIYLNCERDRLISQLTNGKVEVAINNLSKIIVDKGLPMESIYKLNTTKKKIFLFHGYINDFIDISDYNLKWKKEVITWSHYAKKLSEDDSAFTTYSTLNRLNLELLQSTVYESHKHFKKCLIRYFY